MCGFAGFITNSEGFDSEKLRMTASRMNSVLDHRGPDDSGIWIDQEVGIALGHRRLSIIDLSSEGRQPMISSNGRYVICYNGEIYNYREIQKKVEEISGDLNLRGHSDTEVVLKAIEVWGLSKTLAELVGMYSIALWDRLEHTLYLVRDRMGEKPLYYTHIGKCLIFGSELKSLKEHPSFVGRIDRNSLALYMRYNYIPSPYTIYENVYKLLPGSMLTFKVNSRSLDVKTYWSLKEKTVDGLNNKITLNETQAIDELDQLLKQSISQQMIADVTIGSFLSGGIDSSTVTAIMQTQSSKPVKTFSIGFNESKYNEAIYAKEISSFLGTDHTELYVEPHQAMEVIPKLPLLYDEPFADASQIPTYLVSKLAKNNVSVALSGDGGDELFCGYRRYILGEKLSNRLNTIPWNIRILTSNLLRFPSIETWDKILSMSQLSGSQIYSLSIALKSRNFESVYQILVSLWKEPELLVLGASEPPTIFTDQNNTSGINGSIDKMMYIDMMSYLPDDILVKLDRASMGVSLESRVPFLDHRIVEFSWKLPMSYKIREGQSKWILRQVLNRYIPKKMMDRPKMGFGMPIDSWLRGPLREWAEELLDDNKLKKQGYFNNYLVRQKWNEHLTGKKDNQHYLWSILMFQAWLNNQ